LVVVDGWFLVFINFLGVVCLLKFVFGWFLGSVLVVQIVTSRYVFFVGLFGFEVG
jgi:hypothetical protein